MAKSDNGILQIVEILVVIVVGYFLLKAFAGSRSGSTGGGLSGGSSSGGLGDLLGQLTKPGGSSPFGGSGSANLGSGMFSGNSAIPLNNLVPWAQSEDILSGILNGNENLLDNSLNNDNIPLLPYDTLIGDPTFDQGFSPDYTDGGSNEPAYNESDDTATIEDDGY